jgi:hypothetical protein
MPPNKKSSETARTRKFRASALRQEDERTISHIEEFGCSVVSVARTKDGLGWSYTIGIFDTSGKPEIITVGLSPEAAHSSKSAVGELKEAHQVLSKRVKTADSLLEYYSVHKCSDSTDHFQVEVGEEVGPEFKTARSFYFQVLGEGIYTMVRVTKKRDPRCRGRNILEEMSTK